MIHPTAIVDAGASIAEGVTIGAYSIIGKGVEIEAGTEIGPHVLIKGPTKIGTDNKILQFASIGEDPQDKKYSGEASRLEIGNGNLIREYCTINRGTEQGGGVTAIGDQNWIMAYVHIAHDCIIGSHTVFANATTLAGHVTVEDYVILGGFTKIHQFCTIGRYSFTAIDTMVLKDIPPYLMTSGQPAEPHGLNSEGLRRHGFSPDSIQEIKRAYKILYKSNMKFEDARLRIEEMAAQTTELQIFSEFLQKTQRGIIR